MGTIRRGVLACPLALFLSLAAATAQSPGSDRLAFALTGGRVVLAPGHVVDPGVVVVRGGIIEAAGPAGSTPVPPDARVIDAKGKVVHAAFIDACVSADRLAGKPPRKPVGDRLGSIEPGKDATLIVTDGDILDLRSRVVAAWLDGRALDLTDRQKRLYERYRNRPTPAPARPTEKP